MSFTVQPSPTLTATQVRELTLGRLTPDYAHEMRNVLTGISCYLEILRESRSESAAESRLLAELDSGIQRMADLSTRLLELSRGSAATGHINTEVVRVLGLFEASGLARRTALVYQELDENSGFAKGTRDLFEVTFLAVIGDFLARHPARLTVRTRHRGGETEVAIEVQPSRTEATGDLDLERLLQSSHCQMRATPAGVSIQVSVDQDRDLSEPE